MWKHIIYSLWSSVKPFQNITEKYHWEISLRDITGNSSIILNAQLSCIVICSKTQVLRGISLFVTDIWIHKEPGNALACPSIMPQHLIDQGISEDLRGSQRMRDASQNTTQRHIYITAIFKSTFTSQTYSKALSQVLSDPTLGSQTFNIIFGHCAGV